MRTKMKIFVVVFCLLGLSGLTFGVAKYQEAEIERIELEAAAEVEAAAAKAEMERIARVAATRYIECDGVLAMIHYGDNEGVMHHKAVFHEDVFPGMESPVWCKPSGFIFDAKPISESDVLAMAKAQYGLN